MTQQNRLFDDLSRLMTNAVGVAQGAKDEAETAFKGWVDRWLAERDFVTREEFEAVREMAIKARTENAELRARIEELDKTKPAAADAGDGSHDEPPVG
ncbi:accessory factor UbiK family protein [uncultured Paracoccus sp.]|uniref:accessory factor UbiK family protein n=1 Tax=uncultured Paracoccus sp. TaxID=189685 RepID=UPI002607718B|nr:accessory factor UbiK family protein [uncultured Paracoccus sp.]